MRSLVARGRVAGPVSGTGQRWSSTRAQCELKSGLQGPSGYCKRFGSAGLSILSAVSHVLLLASDEPTLIIVEYAHVRLSSWVSPDPAYDSTVFLGLCQTNSKSQQLGLL